MNSEDGRSVHMFWGIVVPFLLVVPYLWVSLVARTAFDIPVPNPAPGYYDRNPITMPASYWIYSVLSVVVLMSPGIAALFSRRTRRVGIGYCVSAAVVGAGLWILLALFEFGGGWGTGD